jgi:CheY-like chemotaxis protein
LAFARRQPLKPERIEANELISGISKLLARTLGGNIAVQLMLDPGISPVVADRVQLETAITNLANNAKDAMPNGGKLIIATRSGFLDEEYATQHPEVRPGRYVTIEVTDTGQGMAPEVLKRIFEPFYTTKGVGKGTGLGLSMVFGFMKQSGGHINVYSEPGRGSTFRLYLMPADPTHASRSVEEAPPLQPAASKGQTILVVEDNAKLRNVVVKQLIGLGYEVLEAEDSKAALRLLEGGPNVDLLFTDVVLPGDMDGCALARETAARYPQIKILLTSGFPGASLRGVEELGARLLSKPYRKEELAGAVHAALRQDANRPPAGVPTDGERGSSPELELS